MKALIGYSGFVGSNLKKKIKFQKLYNSSNIHKINEHFFEEVYCAAPHGVKFLSNKYPKKDKKIILKLISDLKNVRCKKFIHFSTVDVYPDQLGLNEDFDIFTSKTNNYGENRKLIEKFIVNNFRDYLIVRLPALFGEGLKKNALYDLIINKKVMTNKKSIFQWYNLNNLANDVEMLNKNNIKNINLVSEPISMYDILKRLRVKKVNFGKGLMRYNLYTKFSYLFKKKKNYISNKKEILKDINDFFISNKIYNNRLIHLSEKQNITKLFV